MRARHVVANPRQLLGVRLDRIGQLEIVETRVFIAGAQDLDFAFVFAQRRQVELEDVAAGELRLIRVLGLELRQISGAWICS